MPHTLPAHPLLPRLRLPQLKGLPARPVVTLALVAACGLWLTGCSHTTDLAAHDNIAASLHVPAAWNGPAPSPNTPPPATPPADLAAWWQHFGDARMTALITQALTANTNVQSAAAALRQARAQLDVQQSGLWPTIGSNASAQRSRQGNNDASNRFSARLDASWEPDWWGRTSNAISASEANVHAAEATLQYAHISLAAEVALNYVELRSLQHRLHIAQSNLALQQETLQITRWRVQAGLASALEEQQAQQSVAQTSAQIPALQTSLAHTRHALAVLTGQPPAALDADLQAIVPMPTAPATLALALPADTLQQRPDIRAQQHKVQAALATLSAQERANYPSLSISSAFSLSAITLGALTQGASVAASLSAGLSMPIFDAGANAARIRAQEAAVEQARLAWKASVLTALEEVENALVQLHGNRQRLQQLLLAQQAANTAAELARQRYGSGLVDFQTVLDTQRTQLSAQDSVATTQASLSADHIRLYKALGGGWQPLEHPPSHTAAPTPAPGPSPRMLADKPASM